MKPTAVVLLVLASVAVGCADNPSATAPSTESPTPSAYYFTGTLTPSGSGMYSFGLTQAGTVSLTVVSLSVGPFNPTPGTVVGIGFGRPSGTGCGLTASATTAAGLTTQLAAGAGIGTFCASIFDVGTLG